MQAKPRVVRVVHFKRAFDKRIGTQYALHPKQVKTEGDRIYLPLYMRVHGGMLVGHERNRGFPAQKRRGANAKRAS
ncbi:hypothetical protein DMP07_07590 [Slackia faecicanis]|uniref:30S ribosomal protein S19 n=1 Tax=Slackia faecicanis TaxID=255723 RepID=A0A3N0ADX7_9ACTN|nr:hypothetical protein DMP07_07590 [Slackia faecicanis]